MNLVMSHNAVDKRFEAHDDGTLAGFAAYMLAGDLIIFSHTEVDPSYEGRGVGGSLAREGLDDARGRGLKVMPLCPFIKAWIERHGEYGDLLFNAPPSRVTD
ncbi:GNAT family N-acetyltransferase [Blastococcus sp. LR1]|uniref:GNAT family N-acetyltransferase n=1 Tax=Blastococcus sp. LR1 TaxID=2877000 RepID=UPI001CCB99B3|nr:GNAT family N-acetyltransferase [Blastococcus sp. LR1]MCA0145400.1 N-acetyltransferase [Blastococcus sp. LR1]